MYPADWSVHPADHANDISACALFAERPFDAEVEEDWGWSGAQIVLGIEGGCRGSFEVATAQEAVEINGRAAERRMVRDGHDSAASPAYEYFVDLTPDRACEAGRWFYARTESDDPGSFEANRTILDQMMTSLQLRPTE